MSQCKGTTSKGDRCKKNVKTGDYCYLHTSQEDQSSPYKCPICLETIDKRFTIYYSQRHYSLGTLERLQDRYIDCDECKGCFHEECVAGMVDFRCPLCRKSLETELNDDIIKKIQENKKKKLQEDNEEARRITNRYRRAFANEASIFTPNDIGTIMSRVIVSLRGMNVE